MSSIANATSSPSHILSSDFVIGYSVAIALVLSVGMLANVTAIFIVSKTATLQTTTNIHLIGLCISDCIHLASAPILVTVMILQNFVFPDFICKTFMLAQGVNWFAGTFLICSMSIHRYLSVRYPLSLQIIHRKRCALVNVAFLWILAFAMLSPLAIFSVRVERRLQNPATGGEVVKAACIINWRRTWKMTSWLENNLSRVFSTYTFVLGFLIPVLINTVVYSLLIHHLRRKRRHLFDRNSATSPIASPLQMASPGLCLDESAPCQLEEITSVIRPKESRGPAKSTPPARPPPVRKLRLHRKRLSWKVASLVLIYVILWSPYWIQQMAITFGRSRSYFSSARLAFITQLLGYCNSAINPIIYTCLSTPFRKNILRMLRRSCRCGIWIKATKEVEEEERKQLSDRANNHLAPQNHHKQHECFSERCPFLCKCFCDF